MATRAKKSRGKKRSAKRSGSTPPRRVGQVPQKKREIGIDEAQHSREEKSGAEESGGEARRAEASPFANRASERGRAGSRSASDDGRDRGRRNAQGNRREHRRTR